MRHHRLLVALPLALLGACRDGAPSAPSSLQRHSAAPAAVVTTAPGVFFLPPMVPDPGPFSGTFDATRQPTARITCGTGCVVAAFGPGAGEIPITMDPEGESYSALWQAPATLTPGGGTYRLEVYDGAVAIGTADLWIVASRPELKAVPASHVGVVAGSPWRLKFRIESTDDRPAVALVQVTPATSSVLAGATVQLAAVVKDALGNVLTDRLVTWTSSDEAVATVSSAGLVTTLTPGTATITATSETVPGTATIESVDPTQIPAFQRPFSVTFEVPTNNYHDHDEPREFVDANGVYIPWWGESSVVGIDGHEGYDWQLPIGTPLTAVAAGTVVAATLSGPPFFCPILGTTTSNSTVVLEHALPGGVTVRSQYTHVDQINVSVGQQVAAGQVIATSGNRGCVFNPHLHFAVYRMTQTYDGTLSPIDPYGWDGPGVDPWTLDPEGAASINLWKPGEAPTLFRIIPLPFAEPAGLFVQMTRVRFQGVRDALNPNNEYIEVSRDGRVAPDPLDISGFTITTRAGVVFTFPAGTLLSSSLPTIRVYVGSGTASPGVMYWGRSAGVLDNLAECVRFRNAAGFLRNTAFWGGGCLLP